MSRVAYITSGKSGIHRFTYNELVELEKNDVLFTLCLTQLKSGPWMPKPEWKVKIASRKKAFLAFPYLLVRKIKILLAQVSEAKRTRSWPYLFIALSFYKDLRKESISSIHCQMGDKKLYIGRYLKQLFNKPLTVTVHAHELYQRGIYDDNREWRRLFSWCDRVITISEFNKGIIQDKLVDETGKVEIMRLFPDIDYKHKVKDKIRILMVANWSRKKGFDVLFQAMKSIDREDAVLWVVGGGQSSQNFLDLEEMVKRYQIEDKVELLGKQGGVALDIIFSACDIFCLPSCTVYYEDGRPADREGIPVALMEAMAWGKPAITTRHAGNPELIKDILIEEGNVEQLAGAICDLLDHPEKRRELGRRNKEMIKERYTKDNVKYLADIFKRVKRESG